MQKKLYLYLLPLLLAATPLIALTPTTKAKTEKKKKTKKTKKFVAPDAEIEKLKNSPFEDVAHGYMKGFAAPEEDEDDTQQKKLRTEIPQISEYDLFKHIFDLYQTVELTPRPIFNKNGWRDLELLCGEHKEHVHLVYFLKRTQTKMGEAYLGFALSHPISNATALQNRQNVVREFVSNKILSRTCKDALTDVAAVENNLFFFWETESEFNLKAISDYYFTSNLPGLKELKKGNINPYVMEALCFKGRLFSYSLPLVLPVAAFCLMKLERYDRISEEPYYKLQQTSEFKALEKAFEEKLKNATPEQKKAFLEELAKNNDSSVGLPLPNIRKFFSYSYSSRIIIDNTSYSYDEAAEKFGHFKVQSLINARDGEDSLFSLTRQAQLAANATTPTGFWKNEQRTFLRAFEKTIGTVPTKERNKVLSLWQPIEQKLHEESRAYAGRAFINNNNPFEKELRKIKSVKDIPKNDTTDPFSEYTFGDKRKYYSLMRKYLETEGKNDRFIWDLPSAKRDLERKSFGHLCTMGGLYGYGSLMLLASYARETSYNELTNYLHTQMMAAGTVIRAMQTVSVEIKENAILSKGLDHHKHLTALFKKKSSLATKKMHKLVALLLTDTFTGKPSYFCLKGRVLAAYALMKEIKNDLAPALLALGEIDAYLSCATLYQDYEDKPNGFCFVTYLNQETPYLNFNGMWNPFIPSKKAIANSIELGGTKPLNVILTGPNAGGKSTFAKGLTLNVLLAQTIGIAPGLELTLTPFEKINTYMNITDDTAGGNSLFKSEVLRAQSLLKTIAALDKKKFSFSIMDEMFSGTSPREGEAAGYAVAKNLGANTNSISVIATHFPKLKELEKTTGNFKNYQVRVAYAPDGSFTYPFKLEEGAADQNIAIAILQQQGFDSSILNDAQDLLKATPTAATA